MADPFNFDALRKQTPAYLGLGSLKEALPPAQEPSHGPSGTSAIADISMEDQVLSDEEPSETSNDRDVEMRTEFDPPPPEVDIGSGNSVAESAAASANQPATDVESPQEHAAAHKVLSPTQFGAHWALDSSENAPLQGHGFGYEVRMPIPAPWHENLPYTLSTYLQLLFNFGVGAVALWLALVAKRDVSAIIRERSDDIALKASWCHQQYVLNRCSPDMVVPHLFETCQELERCMDRDPANLRWLSIHASLLSEVLNALIEPLTIRTMVSLGLLAFSTGLAVFMINYLFGFLRARAYFPERQSTPHNQVHISAIPHGTHKDSNN